jgi:hypothetical protein
MIVSIALKIVRDALVIDDSLIITIIYNDRRIIIIYNIIIVRDAL